MIELTFKTSTAESHIFVGKDLIEQFQSLIDLSHYSQFFVITDTNVDSIYLQKLLRNLPANTSSITLKPGEEYKNTTTLSHIWEQMLTVGLDRKSLVINLGGGVITDMGAFAACTFMRGIDFVNIPTTLLSQVDASVGGKTGVDFGGIKNSIGSFALARYVLVDTSTLETLPHREFLSGLGEVIKHGFLSKTIKSDSDYLEHIQKYIISPTPENLELLILESIKLKIHVCEQDPQEKLGIRKVLNLGHTIGHAIESFSLEYDKNKHLLHGECVAIGMVLESQIAVDLGLLSQIDADIIKQILMDAHLPTSYPCTSKSEIERILKLLKSDKKNSGGKIKFVLPTGVGTAKWDCEVEEKIIRKVLLDQ